MEVSKRMTIALCLSFVGGVIPGRANFEFDERDHARGEQHNVQPLPETKKRTFDQNYPAASDLTYLGQCGSEEFDLPFPSSYLLRFSCGMESDVFA
jgi:hypothetical protein